MNKPNLNTVAPVSRRSLLRTTGLLGIAAVPAVSLLSGCATGGSDASSGTSPAAAGATSAANPLGVDTSAPLEVYVFKGGYGDDYAKFDEAIYKKSFPKATITHNGIQQVQTELQPRFVAGNPPAVIDNSGASAMVLGTLVGNGQVTDLSDLLKAPSIDDPSKTVADTLLPGALTATTFDGKVMALPYVYTAYGFWYSQSLFKKNGWEWPTTWVGLVTLAGKIKAAGISPFAYGGQTAPDYFMQPLISLAVKLGGVGTVTDIDNLKAGAWQSEPMQQAAQAIATLVKSGWMMSGSAGLTHTQAQTAWVQGKAAIYPSGSWIEAEMKGITPDGFDMVLGAIPSLTAADQLPVTALYTGASEKYIVPAQSKNVRGGLEFLRIMLSQSAATHFSELTHAPTVVKGAASGQDFGSTAFGSVTQAISAAGDNTFMYLFPSWYPTMSKAMKTEIGNLLAGRSDAAGFLKKMQAAADAVTADSSVKKYTR
jgi:N-acetylglucosamine transport system substrate-binding protein